MPKFQLTSPDGKKYEVEGPEGSTPEQAYDILQKQLAGESGNTRGGDLLRGLAHGVASGVGMGGGAPEGSSGWRQTGEAVGEAVPPIAAGLLRTPGGMAVKGLVGAGIGALQPADSLTGRLENAAIGGGSALTGGAIGKMPQGVKTALDHLAAMGIGTTVGNYFEHPWFGTIGSMLAAPRMVREAKTLTGGVGLGDLIARAASHPGLAAYLGIKAAPGVSEAGKYVGQELGKPSQ